ncbi:Flp pilus assembly protein TadD, contains TPR repeats [Dysgonomonas macrotermitis]|uniref:Flp pilus assembly protein TadD, contains TPR repeats n=2 Tax=Dysgonomonas macrotermitis TaxID=1346286 RepID=A0A1M5C7V9_9BACT|nr:Flp pilus assembly protein TadD, contains TPR repeats [Dysgonomonas macrotermitis]
MKPNVVQEVLVILENNRLNKLTFMQKNKISIYLLFAFLSGVISISAQSNTPDRLSTEDRRKFDNYFYDAMTAKSLEQYSAAYDYLQYCMRIDSTNANVLFEMGNFFNSLKNKDESYRYYKKAVQYSPDNYFYNMALAGSSIEQQDFKTAAAIYQKLIKDNPMKVELYMYLSEVYRFDGDFNKSIEALNDLERTMGMNEKFTLQKFKLYSALNDKKKAYAEVQKYIDKNPNDIRYYVLLGNLYMQDGKNKEALASFNKAKTIDADDPFLITSMANYYQTTGDQETAEKELMSSLFNPKMDVDTKLSILTQYITILQQNKQDLEQANKILDSLMVEYPQEAQFNLLYGNLLMVENRKKEANFQYRIYAESDPTNPTGWEQLLQSTDLDSIDELISVCKSAISYLPEEPLFYFYQSIGEFQKKEYRQALETINKGIEFADPSNANLLSEFHSQRGNIYHELDKEDSTFIDYEVALKYNPQNLGVLNNYSYYLSIKGKDLSRAESMSSITIKAEPTNPTYLDTYGWVLFVQGAYTTAKIYLESAVKYSEEKEKDISSEVLEHYGDVLYMTDEKEKALEYWEKAKEKGSDSKTLDKKIETKTYIAESANK